MRASRWLCLMCSAGVLALSGCVVNQTELGDTGEIKQEAGTGFIVATLVHRTDSSDPSLVLTDLPSIDAMFFSLSNTHRALYHINTTTKGGSVTGLWTQPGVVLSEPQGRRAMAMVKVPVGRYVLRSVHATVSSFNLRVVINPSPPPVIEVREGQVTYAGSIQLTSQVTKTYFGNIKPTTARLRLSDDAAQDVPAMQRADPRLARMTIVDGLQAQRH